MTNSETKSRVEIDRRKYLTGVAVGMSAFAGCNAVNTALGSEAYDQGDKETLLPDSVGADWPDQDLEANHDLNENFDRVWATPDESLAVMMEAEVYESISGAEDSFERIEQTASAPNDYTLADEAIIADDGETARCTFRYSNAICGVVSARESGLQVQPDRQRATNYADIVYQDWSGD